MTKRHYSVPQGLIKPIPLVEDQNCYPNYHQFNSCKTIDLEEGFLEEDSQEAVDTPGEAQVPQVQDHQEEDGAHHLHLYCKAMENWLEKHLPFSMETKNKHKCSSTSGSCIGALTTTMQ